MQNGSLRQMPRRRGPAVWAFRWREPGSDGRRVHRRIVIGTIERFKDECAAARAIVALRREIKSGDHDQRSSRRLLTLGQLVEHYKQRELAPDNERKTYSTKSTYQGYLRKWIVPHWGPFTLSSIRAIEVECWLEKLPLARASRAKIRNVMSVLFNHARRYDLFDRNPIILVRQSAKRRTIPEVLSVDEIKRLIAALNIRERTLVLVAVGTGLRQSELFALKWKDVDFVKGEMSVTRSIVNQVVGPCKTEASQKPVPLDAYLVQALQEWFRRVKYSGPEDWVFASAWSKGKKPYRGQILMRYYIRPAAREVRNQQEVRLAHFQAFILDPAEGCRRRHQSHARAATSRLEPRDHGHVHAGGNLGKTTRPKCRRKPFQGHRMSCHSGSPRDNSQPEPISSCAFLCPRKKRL